MGLAAPELSLVRATWQETPPRQADSYLHLEKASQEAEKQPGGQARALLKGPRQGRQRALGVPSVLRVTFRLRVWVTSGVRLSQKAVKALLFCAKAAKKKEQLPRDSCGSSWSFIPFSLGSDCPCC